MIYIGFLLLIILVLAILNYSHKRDLKRLNETVDWYNQKFLRKMGSTSLLYNGEMLNYNLQSFDGGKNWYAIKSNNGGEVFVLGEVETVYPGLMKHLKAWDTLTSNIKHYGSIFSQPLDDEVKKLLNDANLKLIQVKDGND